MDFGERAHRLGLNWKDNTTNYMVNDSSLTSGKVYTVLKSYVFSIWIILVVKLFPINFVNDGNEREQ